MKVSYPRPITMIQQIELNNTCNLKCNYCYYPKMQRKKQYMTEDIFVKSLDLVKYYNNKGFDKTSDQNLWLHGLGESLLHPKFLDFCSIAVENMKDTSVNIFVSTNAILLTKDIITELKRLGVLLHISLHAPDKIGWQVYNARRAKIVDFIHMNPVMESGNWAGQVDWPIMIDHFDCGWLSQGWAYVNVDGSITACCLDGDCKNIIGHVNEEASKNMYTKPFEICKSCKDLPR